MRPLTTLRAKASLPLLNRPLFGYGLRLLKAWGCNSCVMNLHHDPESILSRLGEEMPEGLHVEISKETDLLGTGGGLKRMERILGSGTFWTLNADSLVDLDPAKMIRRHRDSGALVTMALKPYCEGSPYAPVEIDADGRIVRINGKPEGGKPGTPHIFVGVQLMEPELLARIPANRPCETTVDIYPDLIRSGAAMRGFITEGAWVEIGNPRAYLEANFQLLQSREWLEPGLEGSPTGTCFAEGHLERRDPSQISGPAWIGRETIIAPSARFEDGVILGRKVAIGKGARLRRTLLWEGSRVGPDAYLTDCIVAGAEVPGGTEAQEKIFLPSAGNGPSIQDLSPPAAPFSEAMP